jgi:hypothetical protein
MAGLIGVFPVVLIGRPPEIQRVVGGIGGAGGIMIGGMEVVGCNVADQCDRECDPYNDLESV